MPPSHEFDQDDDYEKPSDKLLVSQIIRHLLSAHSQWDLSWQDVIRLGQAIEQLYYHLSPRTGATRFLIKNAMLDLSLLDDLVSDFQNDVPTENKTFIELIQRLFPKNEENRIRIQAILAWLSNQTGEHIVNEAVDTSQLRDFVNELLSSLEDFDVDDGYDGLPAKYKRPSYILNAPGFYDWIHGTLPKIIQHEGAYYLGFSLPEEIFEDFIDEGGYFEDVIVEDDLNWYATADEFDENDPDDTGSEVLFLVLDQVIVKRFIEMLFTSEKYVDVAKAILTRYLINIQFDYLDEIAEFFDQVAQAKQLELFQPVSEVNSEMVDAFWQFLGDVLVEGKTVIFHWVQGPPEAFNPPVIISSDSGGAGFGVPSLSGIFPRKVDSFVEQRLYGISLTRLVGGVIRVEVTRGDSKFLEAIGEFEVRPTFDSGRTVWTFSHGGIVGDLDDAQAQSAESQIVFNQFLHSMQLSIPPTRAALQCMRNKMDSITRELYEVRTLSSFIDFCNSMQQLFHDHIQNQIILETPDTTVGGQIRFVPVLENPGVNQ